MCAYNVDSVDSASVVSTATTLAPSTGLPTVSPMEASKTPSIGASYADPSGTPWTFTQNSGFAGIAGNLGPFTDHNANAPEGEQVGILKLDASISQTINFPVAGTYTLSFLAAQRMFYNTGDEMMNIYVDGVAIATYTPPSIYYQTYISPSFAVTAGPHTIAFTGMVNAGDSTAFIDDVTIGPAIPVEPPGEPTLLLTVLSANGAAVSNPLASLQYFPPSTKVVFSWSAMNCPPGTTCLVQGSASGSGPSGTGSFTTPNDAAGNEVDFTCANSTATYFTRLVVQQLQSPLPNPPTGLTVTAASSSSVVANWANGGGVVDGFIVNIAQGNVPSLSCIAAQAPVPRISR